MSKKRTKKVIPIRDDLDIDRHVSGMFQSRYIQILVLLVTAGFFLRFYNLGFNSLWLDEATTNLISSNSFTTIWQTTLSGEFNPPLFYWMEHIMIMVFGNSEIVLRLLPAIFGVLTIIVIYLIGVEYRNSNVGIIAASAFTFSPFLIYYSQEARAYSVMLFFVSCAVLFYFKALKYNDVKNWIVFGIFSSLAFWSHFYSFVMIASCMTYALMVNFKNIKNDINYIKPYIVSLIAFIGLSLPLIIVTIGLFAKRTSSAPTFGIQGIGIVTETFYQISDFSLIVMYVLIGLFIIGILYAFITDKERSTFLVWSLISIFIISYFLSFKLPMLPRYLQALNIVFFIGIAMSYKLFNQSISLKKVIYGMVIFFMIISIPFLINYYSVPSKSDWRGFSGILDKNTNNGDYIVFVPGYVQTPTEYYYSNITDGTILFGASNVSELNSIQNNNNTIYYVVTGDIMAADPSGGSGKWISDNTKPVTTDGDIYLFKR